MGWRKEERKRAERLISEIHDVAFLHRLYLGLWFRPIWSSDAWLEGNANRPGTLEGDTFALGSRDGKAVRDVRAGAEALPTPTRVKGSNLLLYLIAVELTGSIPWVSHHIAYVFRYGAYVLRLSVDLWRVLVNIEKRELVCFKACSAILR